MAHQNSWNGKILHRTFTGSISGRELLESNLSIQGDPRFDELTHVINDFTKISDFAVTNFEISKIVAVDNAASKSNPSLKIVIVATNHELLTWIYSYSDQMQDSLYECKIFDRLSSATDWARNPPTS